MSCFFRLIGLVAMLAVLLADRAEASVQLQPQEVSAGSVVDLRFHVTNDRPDVFTKRVQVLFPNAPQFDAADASAPAGWSSSVDALSGHVTSISYESGKLDGDNAGEFLATVTVPLSGDRALFRVLQTYSDGQVVQWTTDPMTTPGDAHPAVVLSISGGAVTTTTAMPVTTTTLVTKQGGSSPFRLDGGKIFIAIGIAIFITVVMRSRRLRRGGKN